VRQTPRLGMLLAGAACLILTAGPAFATPEIGQRHNGWSLCDEQALHYYATGMKRGFDFGRNRIEDGKLLRSGKVIPEPHPCKWRNYLDSQLSPPEPAPPIDSSTISTAAPAPVTVAPASGDSGCVGMEAESGSAGYSAMSPTGYIGCYQLSPEHYAPGGACAGLGTDPAGQDACAATICAEQGAGAWTNPAGQNPCGRL
jgi:hypothetical protein